MGAPQAGRLGASAAAPACNCNAAHAEPGSCQGGLLPTLCHAVRAMPLAPPPPPSLPANVQSATSPRVAVLVSAQLSSLLQRRPRLLGEWADPLIRLLLTGANPCATGEEDAGAHCHCVRPRFCCRHGVALCCRRRSASAAWHIAPPPGTQARAPHLSTTETPPTPRLLATPWRAAPAPLARGLQRRRPCCRRSQPARCCPA